MVSLPKRTIWVSYAGADRALVQGLTRQCNSFDWLSSESNDNQRFRLLTYLREDDGMPVKALSTDSQKEITEYLLTFLKPGESIEELIRTIAGSPRRALFVSEAYLNSEFCLKELLFCLCRQPFVPMLLVLIDFNGDFQQMRAKRNYPNIGNTKGLMTLDEALTKLYLNISHSLPAEFRLFATDANTEYTTQKEVSAAIKDRLDGLYDRLMLNPITEKLPDETTILMTDNTVNNLFIGLQRYASLISSEKVLAEYNSDRRKRVKSWFHSTQLRSVLEKLQYDADSFADNLINHAYTSEFIQWLNAFCKTLIPEIKSKKIPNPTPIPDCDWGFLILNIIENTIEPHFLAEIRYASLASNPMRISRISDSNGYKRALEELLALTAVASIRGKRLQFEMGSEHTRLPGVSSAIRLTPVAPEEKLKEQHNPTNELLRRVYDVPFASVPATIKDLPPDEIRAEVHDYMDNEMLEGTFTLLGDLAPCDGTSSDFYEALDNLTRFFNRELGSDPVADPPVHFPTVLYGMEGCEQLPVMAQGIPKILKHCTRIIKELKPHVEPTKTTA